MVGKYFAFISFFIVICRSFLLERSTPPSAGPNNDKPMTDKNYYRLLSMIAEMNKFVRQLQQQLSSTTDRLNALENIVSNGTTDLKNEARNLRVNYSNLTKQFTALQMQQEIMTQELLQTNNEVMSIKQRQMNMSRQHSDNSNCKNETEKLEKELSFTNAKIDNLVMTNNVSDVDFRFIYNKTLKIEQSIVDIQTNVTLALSQKIQKKKQVALTACTRGGAFSNASIIDRFTDVRTSYGISNLNDFKNTGNFTCQSPGLYFVSVHISSFSPDSQYRILKNNVELCRVQIAPERDRGTGSWHTGAGEAVVALDLRDTLRLQTWNYEMYISALYSCVTIIKLQ